MLSEGETLKFIPLIVTTVPIGPESGINEVTFGTGIDKKVKMPFVAFPIIVVILISPELPEPITALINVSDKIE